MPNLVSRYQPASSAYSLFVNRKSFVTKNEPRKTNDELPSLGQRGYSQIVLPAFLLAAIALSVYLVQQRTNITPFAQTAPPAASAGCTRVELTNSNRYVDFKDGEGGLGYKKSTGPEYEMPTRDNNFNGGKGEALRKYEFKDVEYEFNRGGVYRYGLRKGKAPPDVQKEEAYKEDYKKVGSNNWGKYFSCEHVGYDANKNECLSATSGTGRASGGVFQAGGSMSHFDRPDIEEYWLRTPGDKKFPATGGQTAPKAQFTDQSFDGGRYYVYTTYKKGTRSEVDEEGVPGIIGDGKGDLTQNHPDKIYAFVPTDPNNNNVKCDPDVASGGTGNDEIGDSCKSGTECESGTCNNNKCAQGTEGSGSSCDSPEECKSGTCNNNKCGSGTASPSPKSSSSSKASSSPKASGSPSGSASPGASSSPTESASPTALPSGGGGSPTSLTKAEIIGFKEKFGELYAVLGTATGSGNLQIVSTLANNELNSIVSELDTCPDDANVGKCVDDKFRTRFDYAKTAARLSAFYGVFNDIPRVCVKSDIGLNPLITASNQNAVNGRVTLCNDRLVGSSKTWMIFVDGQFTPILSTDTKFPANPTCATLPQDVMTHYRDAETLFKKEAGFLENTLCDGKISVAPGGGV